MRDSYVLDITEIEDDLRFNATGKGYMVEISESGVIKGDGVAADKRMAIIEALEQAGVL